MVAAAAGWIGRWLSSGLIGRRELDDPAGDNQGSAQTLGEFRDIGLAVPMKIFVTGGTGLLGNAVLRCRPDHWPTPSVLVRGQPPADVFDDLDVEPVNADLCDRDAYLPGGAIDAAVGDCDAVIHSAGLIHIGWRRLSESMAVNATATEDLVQTCLRHARPIVHVGTVNTLAIGSRTHLSDETTPDDHAGGQIMTSYTASKRAGVAAVLKGVDEGLKAVLVHPGFMLGPWDWKPSSGRMIVEVAKGWRPITAPGGMSVCDVRDVAAGVLSAVQKLVDGEIESGRHYILAGENMTYFQFWKRIAERTGQRRPIMPAGPLQRWIGTAYGEAMTRITGREHDMNSGAMAMARQYQWHDSSRAKSELGYANRDVWTTIDEAIDWVLARHGNKQVLPKP